MLALALWIPATAFFAVIALRVGQGVWMRGPGRSAPIVDLHGALVTAAYSLGGAAVALGLAWIALPPSQTRAVRWAGWAWLGVTAVLLALRRIDGVPLLVAALAAFAIGVDVCRRLVRAALHYRQDHGIR